MGTLLRAECCCGFINDRIFFGASMEEDGVCYVPALKNGESNIEMINIRKDNNHLRYIFYTDNFFYQGNLEQYHNAWELKLSKKNNLCPKCKNYEMEFIYRGEYD